MSRATAAEQSSFAAPQGDSPSPLMPNFGPIATRGDEPDFRPLCTRCLRAAAVCYCEHVRPFRTSFEMIFLQHPRERRNSIGTARMSHLCLEHSRLIAGADFETHDEVNALLDEENRYCVVVYPGPNALNISVEKDELFERVREASESSGRAKKLTIFAVDGTWAQARAMLRKSPRLLSIPQVSFNADRLSQYKIRRQPNPLCLSTIEATYRLIEILEPTEKAENLLHVFATMVDQQLVCAERGKLREGFVPRAERAKP